MAFCSILVVFLTQTSVAEEPIAGTTLFSALEADNAFPSGAGQDKQEDTYAGAFVQFHAARHNDSRERHQLLQAQISGQANKTDGRLKSLLESLSVARVSGQRSAQSEITMKDAPWKVKSLPGAADLAHSSRRSFCMDGHIAPTFFLLGAQSSGTTSFAHTLLFSAGGAIVEPKVMKREGAWHSKEVHWFSSSKRFGLGKPAYLSRYPKCNQFSQRHVVTWDCTPNYLRSLEAPWRLKSYYIGRSHVLQFVVLLREPAARFQSAFHHFRAEHNFSQYVSAVLRNGTIRADVFSTGSNYAPQIWRWFQVFDSSHFLVVPLKLFTSPPQGMKTPITRVLDLLHIQAKNFSDPVSVNTHPHATLIDELGKARLARFQSLLSEKGGSAAAVAKVLAHSRAELHGYHETRGDATAIAAWLSLNW